MGKRKLSHHVLIPGNMSSHIIFQFWKPPVLFQVSVVRGIELFFCGSLSVKDVSYSHGVRQTLYMLLNNTPGMHSSGSPPCF